MASTRVKSKQGEGAGIKEKDGDNPKVEGGGRGKRE